MGNLHDSLYVEYWGWEYGLPEKSPPADRKYEERRKSIMDLNLKLKLEFTLSSGIWVILMKKTSS